MGWVASTLHTTSEHGVSSITTADTHTSAAQQLTELTPSRTDLNGLSRFARKTKSGFCACAIIFQLATTCVRSEVTARGLFLPVIRGSSGHRVTHPLVRSVYLHVYHSHVLFQFLFEILCSLFRISAVRGVYVCYIMCGVQFHPFRIQARNKGRYSQCQFPHIFSPPRGRVFGDHRLSCFVSGYDDKSSDCENERRSLFCPLFFPKISVEDIFPSRRNRNVMRLGLHLKVKKKGTPERVLG